MRCVRRQRYRCPAPARAADGTGHISDPLVGRHEPAPEACGGHGIWVAQQPCDLAELRTCARINSP
jgi:hypothetical protein